MNADLQRDLETYAIIGAMMEVHGELGNGFLEGVYHYLKATDMERALLVNFGSPKLEYKRLINTRNHLRSSAVKKKL